MDQLDTRLFRDCAGCFTTGVAIVTTCGPDGEPAGVTINSFSSVSLDPPLILFSLARDLSVLPAFQAARGFAVNILTVDQHELSVLFARHGADRWSGRDYHVGQHGTPLLPDTLASFECQPHAIYDGGDHLIFIGLVTALHQRADHQPLLYYRGHYRRIMPQGEAIEITG
ncbi:MAG TPA: flavin reductase family protein [Acetobacteraceae bacterium]|nr:flavin reductase family protein [Acetobacteraceae bacterium]